MKISRGRKWCLLFLAICLISFTESSIQPASAADEMPGCDFSVFADPADPYIVLAEEIAAAEGVQAVNSIHYAMACEPETILWVSSPAFLSEQKIIEAGKYFGGLDQSPMIGIITGSTLDQARELWTRSSQPQTADQLYAANAYAPAAHIYEARLQQMGASGFDQEALTIPALQNALSSARYLTFTGHGGNAFLGLDDETTFITTDVPEMNGAVVATGSCSTIQPWRENNIALRFVDQGASAYVGFVFSPNEGYLQGEFSSLPFRYTWPDFPVGEAVLLQAHGAIQGYAGFLYMYMLGDPRQSLQAENAFSPVEDTYAKSVRIIRYENLPAGMIPIRVKSGAAFEYVQVISGRSTSASDGDRFYNSRVQMLNQRGYKYLLIDHPGGDLTLRLSEKPPFGWSFVDRLLDSLDHTLLFGQDSQGDLLDLIFSLIPGAWLVVMLIKRKISRRALLAGAVVGLAFTALYGLFAAVRMNQITITTKPVVFSLLSLPGIFLTTSLGTIIFFSARRRIARVVGLAVATFSAWSMALFIFGTYTAINIMFNQRYDFPILYNYHSSTMSLITLVVELVVLIGLLFAIRRWMPVKSE